MMRWAVAGCLTSLYGSRTRGIYVPMTRGRRTNEAFVVVDGEQSPVDVLTEALTRHWADRPALARSAELGGPIRLELSRHEPPEECGRHLGPANGAGYSDEDYAALQAAIDRTFAALDRARSRGRDGGLDRGLGLERRGRNAVGTSLAFGRRA